MRRGGKFAGMLIFLLSFLFISFPNTNAQTSNGGMEKSDFIPLVITITFLGIVIWDGVYKEWIKNKFSPYWAFEAEVAVREEHGGLWISYDNNDNIIGFSVYGALEPNWFGPIGVDEKFRHLGIGSILLFKALNSLRLNGVRYAIIPWTQHLFFYSQIPGIIGIRHYYFLKLTL